MIGQFRSGFLSVEDAFSAFINNTAAVAIFLPIALSLARERGVSQSKLLMPLSFASILIPVFWPF